MTARTENLSSLRGNRWRIMLWGTGALILLLPLVAMQFTDEVAWDAADFVIIGTLLAIARGAYELAARMSGNTAYRAAVGIALTAAVILIWMNLAVGLMGSENNPANLMYGGVLAVGILGTVIVRARPSGMARTLCATAFAQALVAVIALLAGAPKSFAEIVVLNALFVALFLTSAWLFRRAEPEQTPAGAAP